MVALHKSISEFLDEHLDTLRDVAALIPEYEDLQRIIVDLEAAPSKLELGGKAAEDAHKFLDGLFSFGMTEFSLGLITSVLAPLNAVLGDIRTQAEMGQEIPPELKHRRNELFNALGEIGKVVNDLTTASRGVRDALKKTNMVCQRVDRPLEEPSW